MYHLNNISCNLSLGHNLEIKLIESWIYASVLLLLYTHPQHLGTVHKLRVGQQLIIFLDFGGKKITNCQSSKLNFSSLN